MEPKPMKTPDLSGLIKAKPRRAPTTPPPADRTTHVVSERPASPAEAEDTPARPAEPEPRKLARHPAADHTPGRSKSQIAQPRYTRSISLYLPRSIHATLASRATDTGQTRTAIILRAVSTHHRDLRAWIGDDNGVPATGGLFDVPQDARATEPVVQTALRVTDAQLTAMDELARQLGVRRSHIMVAALRAELADHR